MEIRSKLEAASRVLFDNNTTTGTLCMPGVASKIVLDVLKVGCQEGPNVKQGSPFETIKTVELVGAALRDIGEISYQIADGTGEIITFSGTFSYHFYNIL
jgi:hypothetical protein